MQTTNDISVGMLVHTTHASAEAAGTSQFVLSNSCDIHVYRVMLW